VRGKAIIGFLIAVVVGNLVLLLSQPKTTRAHPDPNDKRTAVERMASQTVTSYADLPEAAAAAGLRLSRRFWSHLDFIGRADAERVAIDGSLGDTDGDGTPLDLVIFIDGQVVAVAATKGERPDVSPLVGMSNGAEKNVAFRLTFPCRTGQQPVMVGVGPKDRYVPVRSPPCP
jgi:hypothetical protein